MTKGQQGKQKILEAVKLLKEASQLFKFDVLEQDLLEQVETLERIAENINEDYNG
jgi:hypothetical protein